MSVEQYNPEGLNSDPRRQAIAAFEGYFYQIWQTVYRWIKLGVDETLILEGAEDFDVITSTTAETVQVKRVQAINLNSKYVRDAITHFWEHQENNPDKQIRFILLTTAERGFEQGRPFGQTTGIDEWDRCRSENHTPSALRAYLRREKKFPGSLRKFIADSSDPEFREKLIRQIEWSTGQQPIEVIQEMVARAACEFGLTQTPRIPLVDSQNIVPHLLKHVCDVIRSPTHRSLTLFDFAKLFEEKTTVQVTRREHEILSATHPLLAGAPAGQFGLYAGIDVSLGQPPLIDRPARRKKLVEGIVPLFEKNPIIALHGSTGMGKSTLAALVTQSSTSRWNWLQMRGFEAEGIRDFLLRATAVAVLGTGVRFVLDDLNFGPNSSVYENALIGFLWQVVSHGGLALITTQNELPSRVVSHFRVSQAAMIAVPPFSEGEVKQLLIDRSCPSKGVAELWAKLIMIKTSGHPQLTLAMARSAEELGWPNVSAADIMQPATSLETVRKEARQKLRDEVPTDAAKELLCRLSILRHAFRREHAVRIAEFSPKIQQPGAAFDLLVGPWIERVGTDHYRISPLVDDLADATESHRRVRELHVTASRMLLSAESVTPVEVSSALFHGMVGHDTRSVVRVLQTLLSERVDPEIWNSICERLYWLPSLQPKSGFILYPEDPAVSLPLRYLQFRVAAALKPATLAPKVAEDWEKEIAQMEDEEARRIQRRAFVFETVTQVAVPLAQKTLIARMLELKKESPAIMSGQGLSEEERLTLSNASVYYINSRCKTIEDLQELFAALAELPEDTRQAVLRPFNEDDWWANLVIGRTWLAEEGSPAPRWIRCIDVFKNIAQQGISWRVPSISAYAYASIAVIQDEYLNDAEGALRSLDEGQQLVGQEHNFLTNERATVFFHKKSYDHALALWELILPNWQTESGLLLTLSYHKAIVAATSLGQWDKVLQLASLGETAARKDGEATLATGFHAEYAFAQWNLGEHRAAIDAFSEVLTAFEDFPDPEKDIRSRFLRIKVGHTLSWLLTNMLGPETMRKPAPGWFSSHEVDERARELPLAPALMNWWQLAHLEYESGAGSTLLEIAERKTGETDDPILVFFSRSLSLRFAMEHLKCENLVRDFGKLTKLFPQGQPQALSPVVGNWIAEPHRQQIIDEFSHFFLKPIHIFDLLLAVATIAANRKALSSLPFESWRRQAAEQNLDDAILLGWLSICSSKQDGNLRELIVLMRNVAADSRLRDLTAILISSDESSSVEDLYYASVLLVLSAANSMWRSRVREDVAQIITKAWLRVATTERFSLCSPQLTAPAILDACQLPDNGLKKAAGILLAARHAVHTGIGDSVLSRLNSLAEDTGGAPTGS